MTARRRLLALLLLPRSRVRRAAVWAAAVPGPPLLALALVPFRARLGLAGFLFVALLWIIAVALLGGLWPAMVGVVASFVGGAFFFAPPYDSARVYLRLNNVPLVVFVVVGATIAMLVNELAQVAEEQAGRRRLEAALRRVATLVARGISTRELFAAVTAEVGGLLPIERAAMGRLKDDGTVTVVAGWARSGAPISLGGGWALAEDFSALVTQTGLPARTDSYTPAAGWVAAVFGDAPIHSAIATPITVNARPWGVMVAGAGGDRPLPAHTQERLAGFTELLATAIANAESRDELAASRVRVVAAADEARRRIERDLHDGAQQRLVALGLAVRAAQRTIPPDLSALDGELARVADGLSDVMDELREMARGIHPAILAQGGLGPALRTLARRSALPVTLEATPDGRLPDPIEVAAYYIVSETLTNAAKHAQASAATVTVRVQGDRLYVQVSDDGRGGADPDRGSGLTGLRDRVEALGGTLSVHSPRAGGTRVTVELPLQT